MILVVGGVNYLPFEVELAGLAPSYKILLTERFKQYLDKKNIGCYFI